MICEREWDFGIYLLFLWLYCYVSLILVEGIMDTGMGPDTEESRIRGMIVRREGSGILSNSRLLGVSCKMSFQCFAPQTTPKIILVSILSVVF